MAVSINNIVYINIVQIGDRFTKLSCDASEVNLVQD